MPKIIKLTFEEWKTASRQYDRHKYKVSYNGTTEKVTLTPLKTKK